MNENKCFGLVTLFRNNYGSALQCYAFKKTIEANGVHCQVLEEKLENSLSVSTLFKKSRFLWYSLFYRGYLNKKIEMRNAMRAEEKLLNEQSRIQINEFVNSELKPKSYCWKELLEIGRNKHYRGFFTGSDQVWNASRSISDFYFLKFAPEYKRNTYAVSLGVAEIPKWNVSNVKKGVLPFSTISVREKNTIKVLSKFGLKCSLECDPTVLMTKDEWKLFYKVFDYKTIINSEYLFIHFINEPNKVAVRWIKEISKLYNLKIICFGYKYDCILNIKNAEFVDGDPKAYVALIDNADFVCTDSFHTSIFSINLQKDFYVFERQYLHSFPQTGRISDLLNEKNLTNRLITNIKEPEISRIDYSKIKGFDQEREHGKAYILKILEK